jgi:hypothetical protein
VQCPLNGTAGDTVSLTLEGKGYDLFSLLANDSMPVTTPSPETYFGNSLFDTVPRELPAEMFVNQNLLNKYRVKLVKVTPEIIYPAQQTVSTRRVPVKLMMDKPAVLPPQLDHGPVVVQPDSVNIFGPYATIKNISEVLTRPAAYPDHAGVSFEGVYLKNPDPESVRMSTEYVWVYCNVAELTETSVTLPIRDPQPGLRGRLTLIPAEAKIIYQARTTDINSISAEDFSVTVALPSEGAEKRAVVVLDKKPEIVRKVRIVPATVEYYLIEHL